MALAAVFFLLIVLQGALAAGARIDRPIRMVGTLGVNASNADRSVADGKCEREGVREIRSLLEQSGIEELWAFLPRAGPAGSCQWHEIGRNEQSGVDEALVDVDWEYLEALMTGNDPADIHFMMEITSRFHLRHPRGGDIRNRVVTPYGLVDYALTEAGRARYESDKDARTQGLYIKYVAASALDDTSIEAIVAGYPNDIAAAMQRLVASLNTKYLRIEFSPFSND
jgi:hypothetical protein